MSSFHPVSRAANLAFCPSFPIAKDNCLSGTTTVAVGSPWANSTCTTSEGLMDRDINTLGSESHWTTSIFSPCSSLTILWIRLPRTPMHDPTGSIPSCVVETAILLLEPASRATAWMETTPPFISGTSISKSLLSKSGWLLETIIAGPLAEFLTSTTNTFVLCPFL